MQIGSLAICVNDKESSHEEIFIYPNGRVVYDEIYTIIGEIKHDVGEDAWVIEEKPTIYIGNMTESGWRKSRFREVQPPMDVSMLLKQEIKELV